VRLALPSRNPRTRPRRTRRLIAALGCAVFAIALGACNIPPPSQPPKVILYGNSLSLEAGAAFTDRIQQGGVAEAHVRAATDTGICDWFDEMEADLVNLRPTAVVIEFAGNPNPSCVAGSGLAPFDKYRVDAEHVIDIFNSQGVHTYLASIPPKVVGNGTPASPDPWRDMALVLSVAHSVRFADAGIALLNPATGLYQMKMPCMSDEGGAQGCTNGEIQVRDPTDGLHFCPTGSRPLPCGGHVSGAIRYGTWMGAIVASQLGF
jgi:hypothetical protein